HHHRVGLPGQLVELPVGLVRVDVATALGDVVVGAVDRAEVDQPALPDPAGYGCGRDVEDQAWCGAGGDGGGDGLLRGRGGGDLLRGHLLVGVLLVPGVHDGLSPGELLLVVGEPDLDASGAAAGILAAAASSPACRAAGDEEHGGPDECCGTDPSHGFLLEMPGPAVAGPEVLSRRCTTLQSISSVCGAAPRPASRSSRAAARPRAAGSDDTLVREGE